MATVEDIVTLGYPTKRCPNCGQSKSIDAFYRRNSRRDQVQAYCKRCSNSLRSQPLPHIKRLYRRAKKRAMENGMEFSITEQDIRIPLVCPVFGVELEDEGDYKPSIDRIDSSLGYTPDNVIVMSLRANVLKNNGTADEHELIASWLRAQETQRMEARIASDQGVPNA